MGLTKTLATDSSVSGTFTVTGSITLSSTLGCFNEYWNIPLPYAIGDQDCTKLVKNDGTVVDSWPVHSHMSSRQTSIPYAAGYRLEYWSFDHATNTSSCYMYTDYTTEPAGSPLNANFNLSGNMSLSSSEGCFCADWSAPLPYAIGNQDFINLIGVDGKCLETWPVKSNTGSHQSTITYAEGCYLEYWSYDYAMDPYRCYMCTPSTP